jgi:hypothetical protein
MPDPLLTADQVAAALHIASAAPRTRRRLLAQLARAAQVAPIRVGRQSLYSPTDLHRMIEAARCSTSDAAAPSGMRAAPSASAARRSTSPNSAQARLRELTQKLLPAPRKPASAKPTLRALPGGRAG